MAAAEQVLYRVRNGVALITLNMSQVRNALSVPLMVEVAKLVKRANADSEARIIVLTGAGKGFCAGADLRPESFLTGSFREMIEAIVNSNKIVIAAVNGAAAGAGGSLALACDFRVFAEDAYLLQAFINIGLIPDAGGCYFLVRQVGYSKALELSLEGKPISASVCKELGLANKVVKPEELLPASLAWAEQLAKKSLFAIAMTKKSLRHALQSSFSASYDLECTLQQFAAGSQDNIEGVRAFLEKRKPNFEGEAPHLPRGLFPKL